MASTETAGQVKLYVHATLSSLYYPVRNIEVLRDKENSCHHLTQEPQSHAEGSTLVQPGRNGRSCTGEHVDVLVSSIVSSDCFTGPSMTSRLDRIRATTTLFGWTIVGPLDHDKAQPVFRFQPQEDTLQKSLERLWNEEQVSNETPLKDEDQMPLGHFADTHTRKKDGRYEVKLPRVQDPPELENSQNMAIRRFHQNECSLKKVGLLDKCNQVVNEYVDLGHAEPVQEDKSDKNENTHYYLSNKRSLDDDETQSSV